MDIVLSPFLEPSDQLDAHLSSGCIGARNEEQLALIHGNPQLSPSGEQTVDSPSRLQSGLSLHDLPLSLGYTAPSQDSYLKFALTSQKGFSQTYRNYHCTLSNQINYFNHL